ncbi:MAG: ABC transporter permease subunit [Elusimicrobia bacterium]|nr:ABC transporter permease subunit [Elusimicrobiota bacterium]
MNRLSLASELARHTFLEQWRSRYFQLMVIFGAALVYASLLLGQLAVEQEGRVLFNSGALFLELAALGAMLLGCASSILRDMESKTIYLILSRPVPRWIYITGNYLGMAAAVGAAILCMGALHYLLLAFKGAAPSAEAYLLVMLAAWLKAAVAGALAVLVSLVSTSLLSAVMIAVFFWTLGHFVPEASFLAQRLQGPAGWLAKPLLWVIPNMSLFNYRETLDLPPGAFPGWGIALPYALLYICACLLFSVWLFRKREF